MKTCNKTKKVWEQKRRIPLCRRVGRLAKLLDEVWGCFNVFLFFRIINPKDWINHNWRLNEENLAKNDASVELQACERQNKPIIVVDVIVFYCFCFLFIFVAMIVVINDSYRLFFDGQMSRKLQGNREWAYAGNWVFCWRMRECFFF